MTYKAPFTSNKKRLLILTIVLVGLVVVGTGSYFFLHNKKSNYLSTESGDVNVSPPTKEELKETEDHKDDIVDQQKEDNQTPGAPTTKKTVAPVIVDAGQYDPNVEVRAFEPGTVEKGGVCKIEFKQGETTVSRTVDALPDASTTRCTNVSIPRTDFNATGTWNLTVTYTSTTTEGSSTSNVTIR